MIAPIYAAASGFALIALSIRVIGLRRRHRISIGHGDNPQLERAMRVQANFAEYAPTFLIMLVLAEMQGLQAWYLHCAGAIFLAGRAAHFVGIRADDTQGIWRVLGMVFTFGAIIGLGVALLRQAI